MRAMDSRTRCSDVRTGKLNEPVKLPESVVPRLASEAGDCFRKRQSGKTGNWV